MSYGTKVSKPGFDVNTAGVGDLYLDTSYPLLKVKQSGSGSLTVSDGGSDSDTIAHNLGYVPQVFVYGEYYDIDSGSKPSGYFRYPINQQIVGVYNGSFGYTIDSTNLVISGSFYDESSNTATINYFYYIFFDE